MGHLLLTLTVVLAATALTQGRTVITRDPVIPDSRQPRSSAAARLGVVTRDPDAVFFPDSDDPVATDSDGNFAENVQFVENTPASDSGTVTVGSDQPAASDSGTVVVGSDEPSASDSGTVVVGSDEPSASDSGTVAVGSDKPVARNSVASDPDATVLPDSQQPRPSPVVTRDPDVIVFPDSDVVVIESDATAPESVQIVVSTTVANDSDTIFVVRTAVFNDSDIVNSSDTPVIIETVQSSISYSSLENYTDSVIIASIQPAPNSSFSNDVTEVAANNCLFNNDVTEVPANNSSFNNDVTGIAANNSSFNNDVTEVAANNSSVNNDVAGVADDNEVEYQYDDDDVIPDEYRIQGHNDSFAERTGLFMRAAIVAPRRRSNKGRMVGGVFRTPV